MYRSLATLVVALIASRIAPAAPVPAHLFPHPDDPARAFTITAHRHGTKLTVTGDRSRVVFEAHSGIGGVVVERRGAAWPGTVIVRLHLDALEGFEMFAGRSCLGREAALGRDDGFEFLVPRNFFDGNPESFKLEWVDFYRR